MPSRTARYCTRNIFPLRHEYTMAAQTRRAVDEALDLPSQWRFRMRSVMAMLIALILPFSTATADELTTKQSKFPVKETVDRLATALKEKGINPTARVDHAAAAKAAGLELKPTEVLMFGNPKLGTPLMQADRRVAIDLPMKVLVWEDDAGKVWIAYTRPRRSRLATRSTGTMTR